MLFLLLLSHAILAYPSSGTPTTTPASPPPANATSAASPRCTDIDNCRTVYGIVWSSFATIFACVWTAVHRNVPGPSQTRLMRILDMAKIVVVTLLAPEWVLAWAVRQFLRARKLGIELEAVRADASRAWKQMGEVKPVWVRVSSGGGDGEQDDKTLLAQQADPKSVEAQKEFDTLRDGKNSKKLISLVAEGGAGRLGGKWTTRHGFFVIMGGFHFYKDGKPVHPLSPEDILGLVRNGDLVPPTDDEIQGWSQGDTLSKAIAVLQTLWFVVQCIARGVKTLPMAQLEVMTLAYTTITFAMYAFWWYKPLNIGSPVRVAGVTLPVSKTPRAEARYLQALRLVAGMQDWFVEMRKQARTPTFYSGGVSFSDRNEVVGDVVALAAAMVFGAVHCIAWNYVFPSEREALIWRISSAAIVVAPGLMFAAILLDMYVDNSFAEDTLFTILAAVLSVSGVVYIAARFILLALSFTTLWSLPMGAYKTIQWTVHIPHLT
ncbi:hypothetical protein BV25DRAFT_1830821 [Artomyces pyxidatus]|uniref:Uncharacterized protein n=1 Tax=Artomyces pyxidatus TaxID=48021 RepID=A0ACB8SP78_9AGAM|nr:hypothetical protein BV25DRAFT_1830821 [Artomyces pyxidatus]